MPPPANGPSCQIFPDGRPDLIAEGREGASRKALLLNMAAVFFIAICTAAVFWPLVASDFVNYDDPMYITDNLRVQEGLTWDNIRWAFGSTQAFYYPLTWMSHMLDCAIFGPWAGGHHLTSVIIHTMSSILLFLFFERSTRSYWCSLLNSLLFAIHPMHVESVAWISERKEVLSFFFFTLSLLAYANYAKKTSAWRFSLVFVALFAGLISKSMLVSAPLLYLCLDYWPLGRMSSTGSIPRLLLEKIPLFALSAALSVATYIAQSRASFVNPLALIPLGIRIENAISSSTGYIAKLFLPTGMCILYPFPVGGIAIFRVILSLVLLLLVTFIAVRLVRNCPYLASGWMWFAVSLIPVIGLVQVGVQSCADRYTYLPYTGLFMALSFGLKDLCANRPSLFKPALAALGIWLIFLGAAAKMQVGCWQNSATVWWQALRVTRDNYIANGNFGGALVDAGRVREAIPYFEEAIRICPGHKTTYIQLADALTRLGLFDRALVAGNTALRLDPRSYLAHLTIGRTCESMGKPEDALPHFMKAIDIDASGWEAYCGAALALLRQGRAGEAGELSRRAMELAPNRALPHYCAGLLYEKEGDRLAAVEEYRRALQLNPDLTDARQALVSLAPHGEGAPGKAGAGQP